jgi:hypothetical protein
VAGFLAGLLKASELLVPASLVGMGAIGVAELFLGTLPASVAPLIGLTLLAAAELGYWSFELQLPAWRGRGAVVRRASATALLLVAGGALGGLLTLASSLPVRGSPVLWLAAWAAAAMLAVVAALAARAR